MNKNILVKKANKKQLIILFIIVAAIASISYSKFYSKKAEKTKDDTEKQTIDLNSKEYDMSRNKEYIEDLFSAQKVKKWKKLTLLDGKCKEVRICPLFFKGSTQNNEYNTLGNHGNLVGLMDKMSDDGVKVELLRFPFENIETVSPSTSYANGVTGCDTPCTPGAIIIIPTVKSPNAAPLDLEEVPDCDTGRPSKWEIEILDY